MLNSQPGPKLCPKLCNCSFVCLPGWFANVLLITLLILQTDNPWISSYCDVSLAVHVHVTAEVVCTNTNKIKAV